MTRYECQRCHATCFTTDPPHLCADLRKRLERREKSAAIVVDVLREAGIETTPEVAHSIVEALAGRAE